MTIGQRIAKCRKNKNISQEELAEMLGVSRQAVSKWENDITVPDTYNMIQLSKVLGEDVEYLACGNESAISAPTAEHIPEEKPEDEVEDSGEDDSEEREVRDKRKFWGFILFVLGLISFVRFFNPGMESRLDVWARIILLMIISIPCIFGLKLMMEKK